MHRVSGYSVSIEAHMGSAGVQLIVDLPKHSAALHNVTSWAEAARDVRLSRWAPQFNGYAG
jgi:hypothetical protein